MTRSSLLIVLLTSGLVLSSAACKPGVRQRASGAIQGMSRTMTVRGEYKELPLDRVDSVSVDAGKLVFHGAGVIAVDPPASADTSKVVRHWALVTENDGDGHTRTVTFTHNMSLEDFTIELPASDARLHYGVFAGPEGTEVMVFAWGKGSQSFWGYVTLQRHAAS